MSAQTYSTGTVTLTSGFTATIEVNSSLVTLTLVGPSTDWLGLSFNATSMNDNGSDVVIFDGTAMTDRTFAGIGATPPLDASQNWTVTSNVINAGVRTVTATRARDTGDSNDYTFSTSAQPLNLAWAHRPGSLAMGYHGPEIVVPLQLILHWVQKILLLNRLRCIPILPKVLQHWSFLILCQAVKLKCMTI
ncbi:hypothetical protein H9W95_08375 [Flavobacterium lindanitolerans]|nr:hypothetical protein [Flavobacterium lindanitolerans]